MASPVPVKLPVPVVSAPSNGVLSISGSDSFAGSITGGSTHSFQETWKYFAEAVLDLEAFPSIPDGALITNVKFTLDASFNTSASASNSCSGGSGLSGAIAGGIITVIDMPDIDLDENDSDSESGLITSASASKVSSVAAITQEFDFSSSPITKLTFLSQFGQFRVELGPPEAVFGNTINCVAGQGDAPQSGSVSINFDYQINNFLMIVEYNDPSFNYTLNPPGGEVEPGQVITIENAPPGLTYGILISPDDIIIPLKVETPKIPDGIGTDPNGDPFFEVPLPPTEECTGCLAECTECDDCFDLCSEDLDGEECIACLEACFNCLELCLENLDDAESCISSSHVPPEKPIVLIISSPPNGKHFTGTVPLGNFTIIVARGSGLYRFVTEKRNDTLYSSSRDGSTYDVKIPDPGAKTGFIKG